MHSYLIDEEIKKRYFLISISLATLSGWLFSRILLYLPFSIPWWVETPSVLGFFGLYLWLLENHLWNKWPFKHLAWFNIPDLNGNWNVSITSSYQNFEIVTQAKAVIRQTASLLCISLETENSRSYSTSGCLLKTERLNSFELTYQYINQTKSNAIATMENHSGTTWLTIQNDRLIEGDYYNGRGRLQYGKIRFSRI